MLRLERANRRWVGGAIALACAALFFATTRGVEAEPEATPPVMRVGRLELLDPDGKVRGVLGVDGEGEASLTLMDGEGKRKSVLTAKRDGSGALYFRNAQGKAQLLASLADSGPLIVFADPQGKRGSAWSMKDSNGTSLFGMNLPGEKDLRAVMTVMEDGTSYVKLRGTDGELKILAKPEVEFTPAHD